MRCFTSMRIKSWTWSHSFRLRGTSYLIPKSGDLIITQLTIFRVHLLSLRTHLPRMHITGHNMKATLPKLLWMIRGFRGVDCLFSMLLPVVKCPAKSIPWAKVSHIPVSLGLSSALPSSKAVFTPKDSPTSNPVLFLLFSILLRYDKLISPSPTSPTSNSRPQRYRHSKQLPTKLPIQTMIPIPTSIFSQIYLKQIPNLKGLNFIFLRPKIIYLKYYWIWSYSFTFETSK